MPNGGREPYRLPETPSPLHTSDSEETWMNKHRWEVLARRTVRRWRRLVTVRRLRRQIVGVLRHGSPELRARVYKFLV